MRNAFRVWIQPKDFDYWVCVDGEENAHWLIGELAGSFIFRNAAPIRALEATTLCTFEVPCDILLPFARFRRLLSAIPQVVLMNASGVV